MSVPQIIVVSHSYSPEKIKLFCENEAWGYKRLAAKLHRKSIRFGSKASTKAKFPETHSFEVAFVHLIPPQSYLLDSVWCIK